MTVPPSISSLITNVFSQYLDGTGKNPAGEPITRGDPTVTLIQQQIPDSIRQILRSSGVVSKRELLVWERRNRPLDMGTMDSNFSSGRDWQRDERSVSSLLGGFRHVRGLSHPESRSDGTGIGWFVGRESNGKWSCRSSPRIYLGTNARKGIGGTQAK